MKSTTNLKNNIILAICYLYAFLFTYAAISKILDYHDFRIKLGQSPLLSAFAGYVAIGVPVLELIIVLMLLFPRWRISGLFASLCLMIAFTAYIFIILNFSSNIPCSCGGILQDLGWNEHLIFNIVFILLALLGLILTYPDQRYWLTKMKTLQFSITVTVAAVLSITSVVVLFLISEDIIHKRNNFIRRFPSHAEPAYNKYDLKINSYYFAGFDKDTIYLGNYSTPLYITKIDTAFKSKNRIKVQLDQPRLPFRDIKLKIVSPYFFVTDGTVRSIFKGKMKDWKATSQSGKIPYFTVAEPMDSITVALRLTSYIKKSNSLVTYGLNEKRIIAENANLLKKQVDGIFDTDGMLHYNNQFGKLNYIFYYRNQYLSISPTMKLTAQGKTIDTVQIAQIQVSQMASGERQMSKPPLIINKTAAVYSNLLFIKSQRIGKYEDNKILKEASIVDVYNLTNGNYIGSIYIYNIDNEEMTSFRVNGNKLYALSGKYLSVNRISKKITDTYEIRNKKPE